MAFSLASSVSNLEGHGDAPRVLEESEQWLRAQIESLRAVSEESKAALRAMVAREALFIEAAQDIANQQKVLAGQIAGAAASNVQDMANEQKALAGQVAGAAASNAQDIADEQKALAGQVAEAAASNMVALQAVGVELSLESVGVWQSVGSAGPGSRPSTGAHRFTVPKRPESFVKSFAESNTGLPSSREVGFFRWARLATGRVLHTQHFDYFIGLCVLANAISIGVEIDRELLGQDTRSMVMLEYFFVSIYIVEMGMHFFADGPGCLRSGWVLFDFALVLAGSVSIFFGGQIIDVLRQNGASGDVTSGVDQVLVLRMVRLFRLARALRVVPLFKSLWKLVIGFFQSLKTMASTVVLMTITIYIFACLGVEVITKDETLRENEVAADLIAEHFANVPGIMLTLVQFSTMDSIAAIYYPLIMIRPWLSVYFMVILLTLSIAVMNLVTALIVEDALQSTALDADTQALALRRQVKSMVPIIKDLFRDLDRSGDGCIQIDEIVDGIRTRQVSIPREMRDVVSLDRLLDLFEFLDLDGSGELDETEFVDGICHLAIASVPVEMTQILQLLRQQQRDIGLLCSDVHGLRRRKRSSSRIAGTVASRGTRASLPVGEWTV